MLLRITNVTSNLVNVFIVVKLSHETSNNLSDRDSIAVDKERARITFSIRIRKGIALIACDSLSMLVSGSNQKFQKRAYSLILFN